MSSTRELFGKTIAPHHMLNFAEQVYDILVGEIEGGRWDINERLPGVMSLAKDLNFGTKTIQTAYDQLKADGYVESLGYRGTYVKSLHPKSGNANGMIGVLCSKEQMESPGQLPLVLWYEHVLLARARKRNLSTEVKTLPPGMDPLQAIKRGELFSEAVQGVVSLTPFRIPTSKIEAQHLLPVVFLCPPFEHCAPKVCADVRDAYYDLTCRAIQHGHNSIAFSEDAFEPDPRQSDMHREGYLEAMDEHGLAVDQDFILRSRRVENHEWKSVQEHLSGIMVMDKAVRPTVVIAGSLGRNMAMNREAPRLDIRTPDDLSVASIGSAYIKGDCGPQLTGMLPDFDRMVDLCFEMLDEQSATGRSDFTKIHVRMHFVPGATLRSLLPENPVRTATALSFNPGTDLRALSQTVRQPLRKVSMFSLHDKGEGMVLV